MNELDVVKSTEIFLVPGSILVGALDVARTEGLKTGISALALLLRHNQLNSRRNRVSDLNDRIHVLPLG
jgi:hypothetical protein